MTLYELLNELKMSPSTLEKFGAQAGNTILGGYEAEFVLTSAFDDGDAEPPIHTEDDEIDEYITFDDIADFFNENYSSYSIRQLKSGYDVWKRELIDDYVEQRAPELAEEMVDTLNADIEDPDDYLDIDDALPEAEERAMEEIDEEEYSLYKFLTNNENINYWGELAHYYNFDFPHPTSDWGWDDEQIADALTPLMQSLNKPIKVSGVYHGHREENKYYAEPDSSIEADDDEGVGVEIISPPMPLPNMMDELETTLGFIRGNGATNESTGLHINLSIPNGGKIDYLKLVLFLGDTYILQQFGREANTYARSSLNQIKGAASETGYTRYTAIMDQLKKGLLQLASSLLYKQNNDKYVSVNMHPGYVEFRSMGGNYDGQWPQIKAGILRFAQALTIASDPDAYRKEYLTKMYKVLTSKETSGVDDVMKLFSLYSTGQIDKERLVAVLKTRKSLRPAKPTPPATPQQ